MKVVGALVAACLALASCGNDDEPAFGDSLRITPRFGDLTSIQIATLDLTSARRQLGLPADADPVVAPDEEFDARSDESRRFTWLFHSVAGGTLSGFSTRSARLRDAIDGSQVSEVTSMVAHQPDENAVLFRTDQPFAEIAVALDDAGYERDGDVLVDERGDDLIASISIADAGDGHILLTGVRASAEAAAAGHDPIGQDLLALLDGLEGALRFAVVPANAPGSACITRVAVGEDAGSPYAGELVLRIRGTADPRRFAPPDPALGPETAHLAERAEFGQPASHDHELTVPFEAGFADVPAASAILSSARVATLYDC